jgi:hypothetical protein
MEQLFISVYRRGVTNGGGEIEAPEDMLTRTVSE